MRKNFLIKALSFTLFTSVLMTSIIMPVNASVLKGDISESISIVNEEETTPTQTTGEVTDSESQGEKDVNNAEENTTIQNDQESVTVEDDTESRNTDEVIIEDEITEVPDEETSNTESGISPLWLNTDHRDAQCNYVISQLGLNSNQASWLKEGATAPDSYYSETKGFHARAVTNYMACLKAIFMYSQLLGNNDTGLSKKQVILNSMPNISSKDKTFISDMVRDMNNFIDGKGSTTVNQRKYIAYGFGLHLVGDMFAHRVMIKESNLNKWGTKDTTSNKYLQDRDFLSNRIADLKADIKANKVYTASIKEYMPEDGTRTYTLNTGGTTTKASRVYPDNPTFMPKRFNAAKQASVSLVQKAKNGKNFSGVDLFLDDYNLSLHKYSEYLPLI